MTTPPASPTQLRGLHVFVSYPRGGETQAWAEKIHADLEARGATVWRDEHSIEEGDGNWVARIREGLERVVVVSVVGTDTDACRWQQREMLHADYVGLPAVAFRIQTVALPIYMNNLQPVELRAPLAPSASFEMLARALVRTASARVQLARSGSDAVVDSAQREREQVYLRDLLNRDLPDREEGYEPVGGLERTERSLARSHKRSRQDVEVILRAFGQADAGRAETTPRVWNDVLAVYRDLPQRRVRRLAVLGEPGAGKSFSLERFACDFARGALNDAAAPAPLLVRLGSWTRERDSLETFIAQQLG